MKLNHTIREDIKKYNTSSKLDYTVRYYTIIMLQESSAKPDFPLWIK